MIKISESNTCGNVFCEVHGNCYLIRSDCDQFIAEDIILDDEDE